MSHWARGEWTDDTSMALALADSIVGAGCDIDDQARRYLKWWQTGTHSVNGRCFDIGSGYVVETLEVPLWAFHDAADFRAAVLRAVNLGDDADTTGAVCGQLAGATGSLAKISGDRFSSGF